MKAILIKLLISSFVFTQVAYAHDLSFKYASTVTADQKKTLESAFEEVADLLPAKFKEKLPSNIEIKVEKIGSVQKIPDEICSFKNEEDQKLKKERAFVYGAYQGLNNTLLINTPVVEELKAKRENSKRINCQHKTIYDQAIATLVHELTHAYDAKNGKPSNSMEYIRRAGFKKGLLRIKNKNIEAARSADPYELVNIAESFAVNMEYYAMDPEFMCRKPSMFDFFKRHFEYDPYPNRKCNVNYNVMMSTGAGYVPVSLDPSRIYRIDYLQASAGKEIMSGFGHSMFRIVMCAPEHMDEFSKQMVPATPFGKKCLEDRLYHVVVSFRANVQDSKLNYMKGMFGGYPSVLFILNFSNVLDEYNRDELRDVVAYPLKLTAKEREDFLLKVIEDHWNYRGSYKFVNNNCATESYDLLKAALDRKELDKKGSYSPNGVLEDLDKMQFLSMTDGQNEVFKAQTDSIIDSYRRAYGYVKKNVKADKDATLKFISSSTPEQRLKRFQEFKRNSQFDGELNQELNFLQERKTDAASFSFMEQHVLRVRASLLQKKMGEAFMNTNDPQIKELMKVAKQILGMGTEGYALTGYGIPFESEMMSKEKQEVSVKDSKVVKEEIDKTVRSMFQEDLEEIDAIEKNIKTYNTYALEVRKNYRSKLDQYIRLVIKNLSHESFTRSILEEARTGDKEALLKVRELMGKNLVTEKEILDAKLSKIIEEII